MTWYVMEMSTKYNRYAARIPKGMGVGCRGGSGWQLKFRRPGAGEVLPNSDQLDRQKKGGGAKIEHFSWMS